MPVTLDMSTAQPLSAPPVTLDMSTAQPIGQEKQAAPLQPYDPVKFGRFTTEENYPKWAATPPKSGPFTKPGEYEAWTGAHLSPKEALKESARGPAMGAAVVAPLLTGGASLPVQALVSGASGAAQTKLEGGSNEAS